MKQIILGIFAALFCIGGIPAQRHTPVEIKQLAYRKLPTGQKPLGLDLDKYITSYLSVNGGGGGGGSVPDTVLSQAIYEEITHTALAAKIADSTLTVGKRYLISDFKTVFNLNISGTPYTDASVESIIVTALTDASLEPIAYSISHPKDILYYDIDGGTYMPGSTKGCIYRRIDTEKNISVPFDFREFKVEVAAPEEGRTYSGDTTYLRGDIVWAGGGFALSVVNDNTDHMGEPEFWGPIGDKTNIKSLSNLSFFNRIFTPDVILVSTPSLCFNISNSYNFVINKQPTTISESLFLTYGYVKNCTFDALDNCHFNTEDDIINCHGGVIKDYILTTGSFTNNNLGSVTGLITGTFNNNTIAKGFNNNFIASASGNTIAADATGNIIGDNFRDNTIGLRCQNNNIASNFGNVTNKYGNQIGNDFNNNVIGSDASGNVIGNGFTFNTIGDQFQSNNLQFRFNSNIIGTEFQHWTAQTLLGGKDFTAIVTIPNAETSKYIIWDLTDESSWGYWDNGVFVITAF